MANLLEQVVYQSKAMQQVRAEVGPYIESATPILFWGETGSGMGFYAKAIHEVSGRTGKFIQIPGFSLDKD
ncbi:MAG: sigma 54-interacting transcriptional regulator, partial [Candidatus Vecturithrix sp.]|nr:sigma 54-interacting transcriptional regulator [Candidatus Vecturithrix sp.]